MSHEYKPNSKYEAPLSPDHCKASVYETMGNWGKFHQCNRKPWKDGWCKQHHPEVEKAKQQKQEEKYKQKLKDDEAKRIHQAIQLLRTAGYIVHKD